MGQIPQQRVINKIAAAIVEAQSHYKESAQDLLFNAPEYLLTVYIYHTFFHARGKKFLTLEAKPKDIEDVLGIRRRGRKPKKLRFHGRCDLVIWSNPEDKPRVLVEVKRGTNNLGPDAERLSQLLPGSGLEFGVLACCIHKQVGKSGEKGARERIKSGIRRVEAHVRHVVKERVSVDLMPYPIRPVEVKEESWLWRPVCLLLTPNKHPKQ